MKLSIILTSWNTKQLLHACLKSIHSFPPLCSIETIVVDNASKDKSAEMVEREFSGVTLIKNSVNTGYAGGNNIGFRHSSGEYILLLGSDTEVHKNTIQQMVNYLDEHRDVGLVSCQLVSPSGEVQHSCKKFPTVMNAVATYCSLHFLNKNYLLSNFDHAAEREIDQPDATCVLIRRTALDKYIFDERFSILYNDVDLCQRIKQKGWKVFFTPHAKVIHHGSQSTKQAPPNIRLVMYQNILLYYRTYFGLYAHFILAPILMLRYFTATKSLRGFTLLYSYSKATLS